jgi:pimeloyl-ACP methyl ester carboxylesterase
MRITPRKKTAAKLVAVVVVFLVVRRLLLVIFIGLKILGHTDYLDAWRGAVRHETLQHAGIPIDVYGESSGSAFLIIHGVNPTGKNSLDLIRISEALAQAGYQVFVPDLVEMKKVHLEPEEAGRIKSVFQWIGRDAAIGCFSYGCGPALVAAADPDIRSHVRFALAFGGYFDIREALEFAITGPESKIGYLKWVYLKANSDLVESESDRTSLQEIAKQGLGESVQDKRFEVLSPAGKSLLEIFSASAPDEFRARLNAGPESIKRRLDALSPSRFISQIRAPLILVHGINDPVIPAQQAIEFANAARANDLDCSVTLLRMYGHVQPVLPQIGLTSLFAFYLPETVRFLRVVNRVLGEM